MTSTARKILEEALALPSEDRTALIEALSDSLDGAAVSLGTQWTTEIAGRIEDLESGAVEPVEWSAVQSRIAKLLDSKSFEDDELAMVRRNAARTAKRIDW